MHAKYNELQNGLDIMKSGPHRAVEIESHYWRACLIIILLTIIIIINCVIIIIHYYL